MFATILGDLPRPPLPDDAPSEALLEAVLALQLEHGLEPLTAAGWGSWAEAATRTDALTKAVVTGPWSAERSVEAVRVEVLRLVDAGCAWIEVHESLAGPAGAPPNAPPTAEAAERFTAAHAELTDGLDGVHLSLALTGGSAEPLGVDALLAGRYASYAVDLIDGPDSWRIVARLPGDRGVIVGALTAHETGDESRELLLYAIGYAASTGARGAARVGLATSGSLAGLSWERAARKVARLGEVARLASTPVDERRADLDPRAVDIRSAALGRYDPPSRRPSSRTSTTSRKSSSPGD
jgi:hypothetical protein